VIEVYVEGELLIVKTAFAFWHIDPEGKNLDKKIVEMWFKAFTAPMTEVSASEESRLLGVELLLLLLLLL
jgi:hypothetical protein